MRHFLLIFVLLTVAYMAWNLGGAKGQAAIKTFIRRHVIKFLLIGAILFALFLGAVQHPSLRLF